MRSRLVPQLHKTQNLGTWVVMFDAISKKKNSGLPLYMQRKELPSPLEGGPGTMEKLQALRLVEEAIWHHLTPEGGGGHEEMINFFLMKLNSVKKKCNLDFN